MAVGMIQTDLEKNPFYVIAPHVACSTTLLKTHTHTAVLKLNVNTNRPQRGEEASVN